MDNEYQEVCVESRAGQVFQVGYTDVEGFNRKVFIPTNLFEEEVNPGDKVFVDESILDLAIPIGIPWEHFFKDVIIRGDDVAKILYKRGLRTPEDIRANPNSVLGAVKEAATDVLRMINAIVKEVQSLKEES